MKDNIITIYNGHNIACNERNCDNDNNSDNDDDDNDINNSNNYK